MLDESCTHEETVAQWDARPSWSGRHGLESQQGNWVVGERVPMSCLDNSHCQMFLLLFNWNDTFWGWY